MGEAMKWYVIRTATRRERRAVETLTELGWVEPDAGPELVTAEKKPLVYLPVETRWDRFRDSKQRIERPLFVGYIFAQLSAADFALILHTNLEGIHAIVCPHTAAGEPIPDLTLGRDLEKLRKLEHEGEFDKTRRGAELKAHDAVRVIRGHFIGHQGVIKHAKEGERRVTVTLNRMGDMKLDIGALEGTSEAA